MLEFIRIDIYQLTLLLKKSRQTSIFLHELSGSSSTEYNTSTAENEEYSTLKDGDDTSPWKNISRFRLT